jgi:hypothetical protein
VNPANSGAIERVDDIISGSSISQAAPKPGLADGERFVVLVEPSFMRPPVSRPFAGSREAVLALCVMDRLGEVRYATAAEAPAIDTEWETYLAATREEVRQSLDGASPSVYRGRGEVVQYAWIESELPLTATMILAPNLIEKFKDLFGDNFRVVIPSRRTLYVLPGLGSDIEDFATKFQRIYEAALNPVSLEVFNVEKDRIQAAGTFKE